MECGSVTAAPTGHNTLGSQCLNKGGRNGCETTLCENTHESSDDYY